MNELSLLRPRLGESRTNYVHAGVYNKKPFSTEYYVRAYIYFK